MFINENSSSLDYINIDFHYKIRLNFLFEAKQLNRDDSVLIDYLFNLIIDKHIINSGLLKEMFVFVKKLLNLNKTQKNKELTNVFSKFTLILTDIVYNDVISNLDVESFKIYAHSLIFFNEYNKQLKRVDNDNNVKLLVDFEELSGYEYLLKFISLSNSTEVVTEGISVVLSLIKVNILV